MLKILIADDDVIERLVLEKKPYSSEIRAKHIFCSSRYFPALWS